MFAEVDPRFWVRGGDWGGGEKRKYRPVSWTPVLSSGCKLCKILHIHHLNIPHSVIHPDESVPCSCCSRELRNNSWKSYTVLWVLTWIGRIWIFEYKFWNLQHNYLNQGVKSPLWTTTIHDPLLTKSAIVIIMIMAPMKVGI